MLGNRVHHYTMHIRLAGDSGRGCQCVSMKGHQGFTWTQTADLSRVYSALPLTPRQLGKVPVGSHSYQPATVFTSTREKLHANIFLCI